MCSARASLPPRTGSARRRRFTVAPGDGIDPVGAMFRHVYAEPERGGTRFPTSLAKCLQRLDAID